MVKRFERKVVYKRLDVPKEFLYTCFYCGEFSQTLDHVPPTSRYHDFMSLFDSHVPIFVPACNQCNGLLGDSLQRDLYERFNDCKEKLIVKLSKYLMYNQLWDDEAIAYAEFTGDLKKFSKAVVKNAKSAKARVDWKHWPISVEGKDIPMTDIVFTIKMDNRYFKTINHLLEYAKKVHQVPPKYLENVINIVGLAKCDYALSVCKTNKVKTEGEMRQVLVDLQESEQSVE